MVQGGLHQGVAVCMGSPGLPVAQPGPGLVHCHPHPPCTRYVPAQVHPELGTECDVVAALAALRRGGEERALRGDVPRSLQRTPAAGTVSESRTGRLVYP